MRPVSSPRPSEGLRLVGCDSGDLAEAVADGGEVFPVSEDEEDGVVSGDGPQDFVPFGVVDGDCDGLGSAGEGVEDEEVVGAVDVDEEGGEEAREGGSRVDDIGGDRVDGAAVGVLHLDESELADVAGDGPLRDIEPFVEEQLAEDFLRGHLPGADEVQDRGLPLGLGGHV